MNKFLSCRGFSGSLYLAAFLWCVSGHAAPKLTPLTLTSSAGAGEVLEATLNVTFDHAQYECLGGVVLGEISMLICGDQRQAQAEFQSYNENKNAVLAIYQSGKQEGHLFLMEKRESGYTPMNSPVVLIPGFGSLRVFDRYISEPMKADLTEAQIFEVLPQLMKESGSEVSISTLRDRIANKEHLKYRSLPPESAEIIEEVPTVSEPTSPEVKEAEKVEEIESVEEIPDSKTPIIHEVPGREKKTTTVRVIRGTDVEVVEVPRSYDSSDPFGDSVPRRRELKNPHGYDLRNMSLEEMEELERRGLIYRDDD